jgi:hypothetical protein
MFERGLKPADRLVSVRRSERIYRAGWKFLTSQPTRTGKLPGIIMMSVAVAVAIVMLVYLAIPQ